MIAAAIQLNSTDDKACNITTAEEYIRAAVSEGAQLVVLPEKWNLLDRPEAMVTAAEPLDGPIIGWARALAEELEIDLVCGSIVEPCEGEHYNTSVYIDPAGEIRAIYRKLHMFDVEVAGRSFHESRYERAGSDICTAQLSNGQQLGLAICYDLRFPEPFRVLALNRATVVSLPSAFTKTTTEAHWEVLLRARAIENQVFVVAANQVGESAMGESGGHSMIIDPWGEVLVDADQEEGFITAQLNFERQAEIRRQLPVLQHRRADVYGFAGGIDSPHG